MTTSLLRHLAAVLLLGGAALASPGTTVAPIETAAEDGGALLKVKALDAETGEALPAFRVIAGVETAIRAEKQFAERHPGEEIVNWQPHTVQIGRDGAWERPMAKMYDPLALRVESDRYTPLRRIWIRKAEGSQEVTFRLARDPGVKGRVTLPDGRPAAGATIGIALVQRNLRIEGDRFLGQGEEEAEKPGDRWRRPTMVVADAEGRFVLPTETDPACAVVALHDGGIAQMFYADFAKDPEIELAAWGGLEGEVTVGAKPGEGVEVTFSIQHYGYGYPDMVAQGSGVRTDATGKFSFGKVAPGLVQVSLFEFFPKDEGSRFGGFARPPRSAYTHVTVEPGKIAKVSLGGTDLAPLPKRP